METKIIEDINNTYEYNLNVLSYMVDNMEEMLGKTYDGTILLEDVVTTLKVYQYDMYDITKRLYTYIHISSNRWNDTYPRYIVTLHNLEYTIETLIKLLDDIDGRNYDKCYKGKEFEDRAKLFLIQSNLTKLYSKLYEFENMKCIIYY